MVERVARVAYECGIRRYAAANPLPPYLEAVVKERWEDIGEVSQNHWRDIARAAIEAMREPTEGMNAEGYAAACEHDYGDTVPSHEIAPATWRAMIDAALKE